MINFGEYYMMKKNIGKKYFRTFLFALNIVFSIIVATYYSNPVMGLVYGIIYGVLISIIFTVITIFTKFLVTPTGFTSWIYPTILMSLLTVFVLHKLTWDPTPAKIYERIFFKEYPDSVENLKSYCDYPGRGSILRLNFSIDKNELKILLNYFQTRKKKFDVIVESEDPNFLAAQKLGLLYLRLCDQLSWWDMEHLVALPQYIWTDEKYARSLWVNYTGTNTCEIYISAITQ